VTHLFVYKHTVDLENVQRNKKKEKREITGRQEIIIGFLRLSPGCELDGPKLTF
jgi:hypothetical protein